MPTIAVESDTVITNLEDNDVEVRRGARLTIRGHAAGKIHVFDQGEVVVEGFATGTMRVELGARVTVSGWLKGTVSQNDGVIRVHEGAAISDRIMEPGGELVPIRSEGTYEVGSASWRVIGTGDRLSVEQREQ